MRAIAFGFFKEAPAVSAAGAFAFVNADILSEIIYLVKQNVLLDIIYYSR